MTDQVPIGQAFRQFQYPTLPLRVSIAKLRAVHAATHPAGNDTTGTDIRLLQPVPGTRPAS